MHFLGNVGCLSYVTIFFYWKFPIQWHFCILCKLKNGMPALLNVHQNLWGTKSTDQKVTFLHSWQSHENFVLQTISYQNIESYDTKNMKIHYDLRNLCVFLVQYFYARLRVVVVVVVVSETLKSIFFRLKYV